MFRQIVQFNSEPIDSFISRLRESAEGCHFTNIEEEIMTQISIHSSSDTLKKQILITPNITLTDIIKVERMIEKADSKLKPQESINKVNFRPENTKSSKSENEQPQGSRYHYQSRHNRYSTTCGLCGKEYPHVSRQCPAFGKTCDVCKKTNHFVSVCRSKPHQDRQFQKQVRLNSQRVNQNYQNTIEYHASDDIEENHAFTIDSAPSKRRFTNINIFGKSVKFLIDTGTAINIIDEFTFKNLDRAKINLVPTKTNVYGYGSKEALKICGKFLTSIEHENKTHNTEFIVCSGTSGCILGLETLEALDIIKITCSIPQISQLNKYPNFFSEKIGKIKGIQIKLHIDTSVKPVQLPHRRIPFHLRERVEEEIKRMLDMDIIEPVTGPTRWVSPITIVPKPGQSDKIRICTDDRLANKAFLRERHITPTLDDTISDLNGSKHLSKVDLISGYHQLELHPDSRYTVAEPGNQIWCGENDKPNGDGGPQDPHPP
ncbi:unnamed protein product [Brachionus calyciflorus]|uniref:CCHC-type domain-containing protein n=1 Tax=Brachionus calyciflorus TaxID=104777 RepID=A0A813NWD4_9BILA|nr:unnamed protein product [Brachionus calyciflorus]